DRRQLAVAMARWHPVGDRDPPTRERSILPRSEGTRSGDSAPKVSRFGVCSQKGFEPRKGAPDIVGGIGPRVTITINTRSLPRLARPRFRAVRTPSNRPWLA